MGFPNTDLACPTEEAGRTPLVEELRGDFAAATAEHRLAGIDYFSWNSDPWAKQTDPASVYRCGSLTESGRQAIAPVFIAGNGPELVGFYRPAALHDGLFVYIFRYDTPVSADFLPRLDNSLFLEALPFMAFLLWTSMSSLGPSDDPAKKVSRPFG
jgi:hypothetical protein